MTQVQILDAIVFQVEQTPSLLKICRDFLVLDDDQALQVIRVQIREEKDFLTVVREGHFLSEEQVEFIVQKQIERRPLLGNILVQKSVLSMEVLAENLGAFSRRDLLADAESSVESVSDFELPSFDFSVFETGMLEEYLDVFDPSKRQELESIILSWSRGIVVARMREFYRDLHTLKGSSRFLRAFLSEFIIHNLENIIAEAIRAGDLLQGQQELLGLLEETFLTGLDLLWQIRMAINETQSEKNIWSDKNFRYLVAKSVLGSKALMQKMIDVQEEMDMDKFKDKF